MSQPILVQKYGGSSVSDIERIHKVATRIIQAKKAGNRVVVVVSAMGKTTDTLLALAKQAAGDHDAPRRELDMLLTTGERVSMSLLSIALMTRGHEAISFTGSQSGIITNSKHFDARIIEIRPHRIEAELDKGKIVIVAGYQGMSTEREITTLGRGGSDTTAVALAAALRAECCEIYSDVDGIYSADPRVVPEAVHLAELDHTMLQEMAEAGAKVVCAQAVAWAQKAGIKIVARSTFTTESSVSANERPQQTLIVPAGTVTHRARAVVCDPKVLLAQCPHSPNLVASVLNNNDIPFRDLTDHEGGTSWSIPLLSVPDEGALRQSLEKQLSPCILTEHLAQISLVGDGLTAVFAIFHKTLLTQTPGPYRVWATPLRLSAWVPVDSAHSLQNALHDALVLPAETV